MELPDSGSNKVEGKNPASPIESRCAVQNRFTKEEANQCAAYREQRTGEPHYVDFHGFGDAKAGETPYYTVHRFVPGECEENARFTDRWIPINENKVRAERCAQSLRRITGQNYQAVLIEKNARLWVDHYQVVKVAK